MRHLEHLDLAQKQRMDYQQSCITSKKAFREIADLNLNNHSNALITFAQMVHYPNNSNQVGCLYFKVPRKCSLFGVTNEGLGTHVTYLTDEIADCRKG